MDEITTTISFGELDTELALDTVQTRLALQEISTQLSVDQVSTVFVLDRIHTRLEWTDTYIPLGGYRLRDESGAYLFDEDSNALYEEIL